MTTDGTLPPPSDQTTSATSRITSQDGELQNSSRTRYEVEKTAPAKHLSVEVRKPVELSIDIPSEMEVTEKTAVLSSHADALSGTEANTARMSELQGELKRETERMNAKVGLIEAQMRLILKLLRRHNKIDPDPEVGFDRFEQFEYTEKLAERSGETDPSEYVQRKSSRKKKKSPRIGSDHRLVEEYTEL